MEKGFIKLSRKFFESDMWRTPRTYNDGEAWLDLIQSARFEASEHTARVGGRSITWGQGQYPASNRFLAQRWQWSEKRVRTFLAGLKRRGMITTECLQGMNIITLLNYRKYNAAAEDAPTDAPLDAPTDAPNPMNDMELLDELTQRVTQQLTHLMTQRAESVENTQETGRSRGAKNKKGKNNSENNMLEEKETSTDVEAKKDKLSLAPSSGDEVDYDALMRYFNDTFRGRLPAIRTVTPCRRQSIRARVRQYGKEGIMEVFRLVSQSAFLTGGNERGWKADFDWIFKQENFTKILEGNYNGKQSSDNRTDRRESVSRLKELAAAILQGADTAPHQ